MILSLDRPALFKLIDADPQFELDLKRAVVSEVARRVFDKDADRIIKQVGGMVFTELVEAAQLDTDFADAVRRAVDANLVPRPASYSYEKMLSPAMQKKVREAAETAERLAEHKVHAMVDAAITDRAKVLIEPLLTDGSLDERISKRVDRLVDQEIGARVKAKFDERMAGIRDVLGTG